MGRASRRKRERYVRGGLELPRNVPAFLRTSATRARRDDGRPKISESLAEVLRPFIDEDMTVEEFRSLVGVAAVAWNLSLLEDHSPDEVRRFLEQADVPDRESFESFVSELVLRKNQLFPDDERFIAGWEVVPRSDGTFFLTASALESGE